MRRELGQRSVTDAIDFPESIVDTRPVILHATIGLERGGRQ